AFFVDPWGDVIPCNGMVKKAVMGSIRTQEWNENWDSEQAENVRRCVKKCTRNCWMIGSVSPAMHK
ncbi:SPASM domain-containing protein, partial [Blautia schinkii]